MADIVQDIQKPVGTSENTVVGLNTELDTLPVLESGVKAATDAISKSSKNSQSGKDYGPLARALQEYRDIINSKETTGAYKEEQWDSLVDWAATQGYTSSEIEGYAKTTGTEYPLNALRQYQKMSTKSVTSRQQAFEKDAALKYPNVQQDQAEALLVRDRMDQLKTSQAAQMAQSQDPEDAETTYREASDALIRQMNNAFYEVYQQYGNSLTMDRVEETAQTVREAMQAEGWPVEEINMHLNWLTDNWKDIANDNTKTQKLINQGIDVRKQRLDLQIGLATSEKMNTWLMQPISIPVYDPEKSRGAKEPVYMTDADGKVLTRTAKVIDFTAMAKYDPTYAEVAYTALPPEVKIQIANAAVNASLPVGELTQSSAASILSPRQIVANLYSSSTSPEVRAYGANLVNTALSTIQKDSANVNDNLENTSASGTTNVHGFWMQAARNSVGNLQAEDFQRNDEDILRFREVMSNNMRNHAETLHNSFINSLPLFDDKGNLRLFSFEFDESLNGYRVKDISNDSYDSDSNNFREFYDVQTKQYIKDIQTVTGWDEKTVKELYNSSVIINSLTGRAVANGLETPGRGFTGTVRNLYNAMIGETKNPSLFPPATVEMADEILKGISTGKIENRVAPPASQEFFPKGTQVLEFDPDGSFVTVRATAKDTRVFAPVKGTLITNIGGPREVVFREADTGIEWHISGVGVAPGDPERELIPGNEIGYQDPTSDEGVTIFGIDKDGDAIDLKTFRRPKKATMESAAQVLEDMSSSYNPIQNAMASTAAGLLRGTEVAKRDYERSNNPEMDRVEVRDISMNYGGGLFNLPAVSPVTGTVKAISNRKGLKAVIVEAEDGSYYGITGVAADKSLKTGSKIKEGDTLGKGEVVSVVKYPKGWTFGQPKEDVTETVRASGRMVAAPNIDLNRRTPVTNMDGTVSTEDSITIEEDNVFINIPTIIKGKRVTDEEALTHYHRTGEHLGKFTSKEAAVKYAEQISELQAKRYGSEPPKNFWMNPRNGRTIMK